MQSNSDFFQSFLCKLGSGLAVEAMKYLLSFCFSRVRLYIVRVHIGDMMSEQPEAELASR